MILLKRNSIFLYALIFFVINFLQAFFSELIADEAYYWMYSQKLAWGYYDHPPLVAVFIRLGYLFFKNELGVRLFTVVISTFNFILIWKLFIESKSDSKNFPFVYFMFFLSVPVFNLYGFIATPDYLLLFFSTLYLFFFKKFLTDNSIKTSLIIGIIAGFLVYSKYHGLILIFISLIFNIKVVLKWKIWIAGIIAILMLLPHIFWQFNNDFPTFQYHLSGRNTGFSIMNFVNFILNTFIILNPLFLIFIIKNKIYDKNEKYLYSIFWGIIAFFFISAYKGRTEPHWIAVSAIPLIIISYKSIFLNNFNSLKPLFKFSLIFSVLIFFVLRTVIPFSILHRHFSGKYIAYKEFSEFIENKPVVFMNSFQAASLYNFYTDSYAISSNSAHQRQNQFSIWDYEKYLYKKNVVIVYNYVNNDFEHFYSSDSSVFQYSVVEQYMPVEKIKIDVLSDYDVFEIGEENYIKISLFNPYDFDIYSLNNKDLTLNIVFFFKDYHSQITIKSNLPDTLKSNQSIICEGSFKIDTLPVGTTNFKLCLNINSWYAANNSDFFQTKILKNEHSDNLQ